jgi:hypothetical protein
MTIGQNIFILVVVYIYIRPICIIPILFELELSFFTNMASIFGG